MLFDSFTVVAQLVNFLVLVWLLKRYLYRPILDAIEARQKHIDATIRAAEEQQAAAQAERRTYEEQNDAITEQHDTLIRQAMQQADDEKLRLLADARKQADTLRNAFEKRRVEEDAAAKRELITRTQAEVLEIVRRVLRDLADTNLEETIIAVVSRRLGELDAGQQSKLVHSVHTGGGSISVKTGFQPSTASRETLTAAIRKLVGPAVTPQFDSDQSLVCGVEVDLDGRRIAWNVSDYLCQFQEALDHAASTSVSSNQPARSA
jgi:F-type H+-transporting ATPase subunit b